MPKKSDLEIPRKIMSTMTRHSFKRGYSFRVKGAAPEKIIGKLEASEYAHCPFEFDKLKVQMSVEEGAAVKVGTEIYRDKNRPEIIFRSPVAGKVTQIEIGRRRVFKSIRIQPTGNDKESLDLPAESSLDGLSADDAKKAIYTGGMWGLLKSSPLDLLPDTDTSPQTIYVSAFTLEPNTWSTSLIADAYKDDLSVGLKLLGRIAKVVVLVPAGYSGPVSEAASKVGAEVAEIKGKYGTESPYAYAFRINRLGKGEQFWHTDLQGAGLLGKLIRTGQYPSERLVGLAGEHIKKDARGYYWVTQGAKVNDVLGDKIIDHAPKRYVSGGLLTGKKIYDETYFLYHQSIVNVIGSDKPRQLLSFFRLGFDRSTYSKAYASAMVPNKEHTFYADLNGEERACIQCGYCTEVCPVDLLPDILFKTSLAEDFDKMEALGIYDCSGCNLCTYVCPSKIEVAGIIKEGTVKLIEG